MFGPTRRRRLATLAVGALAAALMNFVPLTDAAYAAPASPVVDDFEGTVPITTGNPGIFPFGNDASSTPVLSQVAAPDRPGDDAANHGLDVPYHVTQYGGFTHDLSASQDWSSYGGFAFWVKGTGSGQRIEFEIKDGGSDGEHSELWQAFFTDDTAGWRQVQEPFGGFVRRTDYQPSGAPTDGHLDLTAMWGYAVNLAGNSSGELVFDQVSLTGSAVPQVAVDKDVLTVDAGGSATVNVVASQPGGGPLGADVTASYTVGGGTAVDGTDFTAASGTVTFPAGTPSGTSKPVTVSTIAGTPPSVARTILVKLSATGVTVTAPTATVVINAHGLPYQDASLPVAQRVADLMSRMTLADKVGQMTQAERNAVGTGDILTYRLGSLLSGGGSVPTPNTPQAWADMIDNFQLHARATPLQIPLIYGIDSVHGDNNLQGATVFPHNIGMGATRDPALAKKEGQVTADEMRATGIPWAFAPCVCVTRDERWGRSYESFGEDPALVQQMETVIDGLQEDGKLSGRDAVLATAKHFLGDGGTAYGSSTSGSYTIDQGVTYATQQQVDALYLPPYQTAVDKGVGSVMPSYSSLQILGKDSAPVKMHARTDQITGVLKGQLGFKGFVISDWSGIDQISPDYKNDVKIGINAGIDMVMVPYNIKDFTTDLTALANSGDVATSRIDDAVSRILTQKFKLGLFEHPYADRTDIGQIGGAAHRQVARQAAAESQVLLKNSGNVLPLAKNAKVYVAGSNADDLGNQTGGWTLTWQGSSGPGDVGTTILAGMKQVAPNATITYSKDASAPMTGYNVGVVVVGETPYAEGVGDVGNGHGFQLSTADRAAVDKVCAAMKCVVLTVSGRPLDITGIVPEAAGVVASWLPGTEGAGVADVLFGDKPFTGRLPETWMLAESQLPVNVGDATYNPLYPFGWGLRTDNGHNRLQSVRDQLAAIHGDSNISDAVRALDKALRDNLWNRDGTVRNGKDVLGALQDAGNALNRSSRDTFAQDDLVVSVARDIAQAAVGTDQGAMAATATLTSNAEHALLTGRTDQAVSMLSQAYDRTPH